LIKSGAANYVVAPRPLKNQRSKHQKTDRLDARVRSFLARICQAQKPTKIMKKSQKTRQGLYNVGFIGEDVRMGPH
jgi:hypothetical protein